jgi:hypothetical protein
LGRNKAIIAKKQGASGLVHGKLSAEYYPKAKAIILEGGQNGKKCQVNEIAKVGSRQREFDYEINMHRLCGRIR